MSTRWAAVKLTPEASNAAEYLSDVERVDFCDYLQRIHVLLDFSIHEGVRIDDVPIHLVKLFREIMVWLEAPEFPGHMFVSKGIRSN